MTRSVLLALALLVTVSASVVAQAPGPDTVNDPGLAHPPGGTTPHWIMCTANWQRTIFKVKIYAFALYVDPEAARASLSRFAGVSASALEPARRLATSVEGDERPRIDSRALCRALFDVYLGEDPISGGGKRSLIAGFPGLLASGPEEEPPFLRSGLMKPMQPANLDVPGRLQLTTSELV